MTLRPNPPRRRRASTEAGFSLVELLVGLLITVQILVAAAVAFDIHTKVAQAQMQIADMQQSQRVAQTQIVRSVRTAGRGGLPADIDPDAIFNPVDTPPLLRGLAIEVRNNVPDTDLNIARGNANSPEALEDTDILTVRGCYGGSVYQVDASTYLPVDADADGNPETATLTLPNRTPLLSLRQPLDTLMEELDAYEAAGGGAQMILVSPEALQTYGIAEVTDHTSSGGTDPDTLALTFDLATNSPLNPDLDGDGTRNFPIELSSVIMACLLEEYRYYVRDVPGDDLTDIKPRLARARFEPGTELPYLGDTQNFRLDLADNIVDLQVALGFDSDHFDGFTAPGTAAGAMLDDSDFIGVDDVVFEADLDLDPTDDPTLDDWLYNDAGDDDTSIVWTTHSFGSNAGNAVHLKYVRVTTVARTARPDRSYEAPEIDDVAGEEWIEDNDWEAGNHAQFLTPDGLKHRRRILTTTIEPRNV